MPLARVDVLSSGTTGVDDIAAEDSSVKEVYSLGGVRVASGDDVDMQSLAPGMYIVRQGSKYTKVLR